MTTQGRTPAARARGRLLMVAATVALVAAGCASNAPQDTFDPAGQPARTIQDLVVPVFLVAAGVFVFVEVGLLVIMWRFRKRRGDESVPHQLHGHTRLEVTWTIIPAAILAFVAVGTVITIFDLDERQPDNLEVIVYGQQWWWEFEYPEQGIVTANELVIPAGPEVNLLIRSRDVIHSFWAPRLNGKKDAVPGRTHPWKIQADEPGIYLGQCVEFCGLSHANMRLRVRALSPEDFEAWVASQQQPAPEPTTPEARAGLETFTQLCSSCHQINGVNEVARTETGGAAPLVPGVAPNLTHLMSRDCFAGCMFDLWTLDAEGNRVEFNRATLEAWLRNPPAMKPMASDDARGMPNLNLTEEQIDNLVAYLMTLE